ncbi:MAG: HEPN domain-containing protein [Bacteroidales bacterium]|nr:HEPN domain-containing protein [Bacteroidales bacterium]
MSDRLEEIKQWIIKGDHDLGTAKITFLHIPEYLDTVTFHCQQAVEKYLKAFLVFLSKPFRFSHDLVYLLDLISENDPDFAKYYDSISELQGYAVEIRYPDETIFLSQENVKQAISIAKDVRDFITKKMDITIEYNIIIDK